MVVNDVNRPSSASWKLSVAQTMFDDDDDVSQRQAIEGRKGCDESDLTEGKWQAKKDHDLLHNVASQYRSASNETKNTLADFFDEAFARFLHLWGDGCRSGDRDGRHDRQPLFRHNDADQGSRCLLVFAVLSTNTLAPACLGLPAATGRITLSRRWLWTDQADPSFCSRGSYFQRRRRRHQ
jgi:hypothetical protein